MHSPRFFVGLGSNIDYEMTLTPEVARWLTVSYDSRSWSAPESLETASDLYQVLKEFVAASQGGEVGVSSQDAIEEIASAVPVNRTAGGTGIRAGIVLSQFDQNVVAHLTSGGIEIKDLLPASMTLVNLNKNQGRAGHLVVQYPKGAVLGVGDGEVTAARPNRIIMVRDDDNARMRLSESLEYWFEGSDVILLSGLNAVTNKRILTERVAQLKRFLKCRPDNSIVVFEDAAYHDETLRGHVRTELGQVVDIWSMNEEEAALISGTPVVDICPKESVTAMRQIRELIGVPTLVVHTAQWAAAVGSQAHDLLANLQLGNVTAGARFALGDNAELAVYRRATAYRTSPEGDAFANAVSDLGSCDVVAASSMDFPTKTPTTVGLGDAFMGGFLAAFSDSVVASGRGFIGTAK